MEVERFNFVNKLIIIISVLVAYTSYIELCVASGKSRRNRIWTRTIFTENQRTLHGFFEKLFTAIKLHDSSEFRKATRMGVDQFDLLCGMLKNRIKKQNCVQNPISPECRLVITLVYLSQGAGWQMLAWSFRVGVTTIRNIIYQVCDAIWDELSGIYLAPPKQAEWVKISDKFYDRTGMPNVVGAIDGKHIESKCPPRCGTLYYNYKQYHSIVLLAACDSDYLFTAVNVGAYGSQSDGGIFQLSGFGKHILQENINLPNDTHLPNSSTKFPYYFIGDAAFPLKKNLMRPYPGRLLPNGKRIFNKRLSKARVKIENTFGILAAKWRVLTNSINCFPENAEKIVKATLVLHNFVKSNDMNYCPSNYVDHHDANGVLVEGIWRRETDALPQARLFTGFNCIRHAFNLRDTLKEYLMQN